MPRAQKSPIRTSRTVRRRHRSALLKTIILVLGLGGFTYCFSWLSQYPTLSIGAVSVSGIASSSDQALVQEIAERDVSGSYFHLFSKANIFLYPRSKIIADIRSIDPQIAAVALAMGPGGAENTGGTTAGRMLSLTITERQPAYEWCSGPASATNASSTLPDSPASITTSSITTVSLGIGLGSTTALTNVTSPCYVMDATGYVFAPTTAPPANPFFRFYGRLDASTTPIGLQYLPPADFQNLNSFISSITASAGQNVASYALVDRADGVDELFLKSGGVILFDDTEDLSVVSADISALAANSPVFSYGSTLQYLDLRVSNKAFYKLVGAGLGNTGTTTAGN